MKDNGPKNLTYAIAGSVYGLTGLLFLIAALGGHYRHMTPNLLGLALLCWATVFYRPLAVLMALVFGALTLLVGSVLLIAAVFAGGMAPAFVMLGPLIAVLWVAILDIRRMRSGMSSAEAPAAGSQP